MQPRVISESQNDAALSSPTIADVNNFILSLHSVHHNTLAPSLSFPHHCTILLPLFPPFILQYFYFFSLNIACSPLHLLNLFN